MTDGPSNPRQEREIILTFKDVVDGLHAEIERLRAALDRAADALEFYDNKTEAMKARAALEPKP